MRRGPMRPAMGERKRGSEPSAVRDARLQPEIVPERRDARSWEQRLHVPSDLACWPGHFPVQRIVPGVLQIDWVMRLVARWIGATPRLLRIEGLKFKRPIHPGQSLDLRLELHEGARFRFSLEDGGSVFALGRLVIEEGGENRP